LREEYKELANTQYFLLFFVHLPHYDLRGAWVVCFFFCLMVNSKQFFSVNLLDTINDFIAVCTSVFHHSSLRLMRLHMFNLLGDAIP